MTSSEHTALVFLSCGGTIEKTVLPHQGQLGFDHSRVSEWAATCRIAQTWRSETLMLIDSLEMTDADRNTVAAHVARIQESQVVILHGTDTMVQTAAVVAKHRQLHQTIVFTGAMIPVSQSNSDGLFNIGMATAAVQLLEPGVYIAMSGQVFPADAVRKNREKGVFEAVAKQAEEPSQHQNDNGTLRITKRKWTGSFR